MTFMYKAAIEAVLPHRDPMLLVGVWGRIGAGVRVG